MKAAREKPFLRLVKRWL